MVIYAGGGSEGTAVEAASRTGRRERAEKSSWLSFSASSLHTHLSLCINTAFLFLCECVRAHTLFTVHLCACNECNGFMTGYQH